MSMQKNRDPDKFEIIRNDMHREKFLKQFLI